MKKSLQWVTLGFLAATTYVSAQEPVSSPPLAHSTIHTLKGNFDGHSIPDVYMAIHTQKDGVQLIDARTNKIIMSNPSDYTCPADYLVCDYNNDGLDDIIVASLVDKSKSKNNHTGELSVLKNLGNGFEKSLVDTFDYYPRGGNPTLTYLGNMLVEVSIPDGKEQDIIVRNIAVNKQYDEAWK